MSQTRKTIVITGASDGIGAAAARQLHALGHEVVVVGRSPEKTRLLADALSVSHHVADFARLEDIRKLAAKLEAAHPRIDVLANNAGGVFGPGKTVDGFEQTFQINHLAPFLLTKLLMGKLVASGASILQTASAAARAARKGALEELAHAKVSTPGLASYANAKFFNILFTQELHRRFGASGISSAAFHPGVIASNFANGLGMSVWKLAFNPLTRFFMATPEKGAAQLVWLATTTPGKDWESGAYYEKFKPTLPKQARDAALARVLWERSEALLS